MARETNELSATQLNDDLFTDLVRKIKRVGVMKLTKFGNVSHTTICKYCRREPINPKNETELKKMVERAIRAKLESDKEELESTKKLLSLC